MSDKSAVILITGCSTGFGRALAEAALIAGLRVIATARRPETLVSLQEKGAKALKLDVTASPTELNEFAASAISLFGKVDCLINNAGFLQGGALEEATAEEHLAQFNTNVFGVINVTNAFLPHWRARKQGTIVNISSMGAMLFIPGAGIYCASKAALDAVSETWARELAPFNIRSVSIQPGSFRTAVAESGNMKTAGVQIEGYDAPHAWVDTFNQTAGKERGDTEIAAAKIIELVSVDPSRALPGRLTIGEDAYVTGKTFYERGLKDLEEWKAFSTGTDAVDQ
ncbi:putative short-chain oxidoreductase [Mycena albidolilacea]|uniref:Short-chain oxidoreductase n=1 Tax=Mycena albidolilacea TaxID=1033008 RepID=A0AAD6ZS40_9AGAR|nr:putative short-chain oxidoreductase [Mycena albidolilacea]